MLLVVAAAAAMLEENSSGVQHQRVYGRNTALSLLEPHEQHIGGLSGWQATLHNGFEIWWLAGMPLMLVFLLTLVSLSMASGLEKRLILTLSVPVPAPLWRWATTWSRWALVWTRGIAPSESPGDLRRLQGAKIPRHIAVIMDGNRRYGKQKYGTGLRGHADGSRTLVAFTDWCIEAGVEALTVFAFSTENWNREQVEVDTLLNLFKEFMHEIVPEARKRDIRVRVLVSDGRRFPTFITEAIDRIEAETSHCRGFQLNICVSYGARDEIVGACRRIATEVAAGDAAVEDIDEAFFGRHLLSADLPDPDVLVRTSGEQRISNFLLYQIAYAELIFLDKNWPEITREDLHEHVILEFNRRKRRFGK